MGKTTTRKRPWTAKQVRDLCEMRKAGATVRELAGRFGRTVAAVKHVLRSAGVRLRDVTPPEPGESARDYERRSGLSRRAAARMVARLYGPPPDRDAARRLAAASLGWPEAATPSQAATLSALPSCGGWAAFGGVRRSIPRGRAVDLRRTLRRLVAAGLVERRGPRSHHEYRLAPHLAARRYAS